MTKKKKKKEAEVIVTKRVAHIKGAGIKYTEKGLHHAYVAMVDVGFQDWAFFAVLAPDPFTAGIAAGQHGKVIHLESLIDTLTPFEDFHEVEPN